MCCWLLCCVFDWLVGLFAGLLDCSVVLLKVFLVFGLLYFWVVWLVVSGVVGLVVSGIVGFLGCLVAGFSGLLD